MYFFILFAEGLVSLVNDAESEGFFKGFKVSKRASSISHLLFFDDSLLFFRVRLLLIFFSSIKNARASWLILTSLVFGSTHTPVL